MSEPSSERYLDIPRIVMPIQLPGAAAQPPDDFSRAANPILFDPADADDCSHRFPYVMRSKQFGSAQPADETDPLALSEANPDTWDKDAPQPLRKPVAISLITVADAPEVTTAPHGIPIGKTALVKFSATNSVPTIDGVRVVKALTATTVSVLAGPATEELGNTGKMALVCDGVTYDATPRTHTADGVTKTFTRQVNYDSCGELYFIGPEVEVPGESCTKENPYVMRSSRYGSTDPFNHVGPDPLGQAAIDTWDKDQPPHGPALAISLITAADPPVVTTASHGITIGKKARVRFSGTNCVPNIDGIKVVTALSTTTVSGPTGAVVPGVGAVTGTMSVITDGVTYDPVPRIYKAAGVTKKFARQVKYESCGELYYIGIEVEIESCSSSNPYLMGSRLYGSTQPTDTSNPKPSGEANTDTWDRSSPPIYNSVATDGVTYDPVPRIYKDTVAGVTKIFTRQVKYDSCGELYYIGIEVKTEITGSGGPAPSCTSNNFYRMRSSRYGSTNPNDTSNPSALDTANQDTWDRANQPVGKDSVTIGTLPRFHAYPYGSSLFYKVFDRDKKYNSCGELIYVGQEKLVFEMQTYGSIVTTAELP